MRKININYTGATVFITNITTLRDGGTFVLMTSNKYEDDLHINHKTFELHDGYPLTPINLITDKDFRDHVIYRIERYLEGVEQSLKQNKELLLNFIGPETDEELLENYGWCIECESPYEIRHEDGSFVTGSAVKIIISGLKKKKHDGNVW